VSSRYELTAVFRPVENGWVEARIEELPGVITAAPTLDEAKELLPDALHEYLLALGQVDGHPLDESVERLPLALTLDV
jgi:predicted RNase H-like HicB family nuclease